MKTSETISSIAAALAAAQGEFPKIAKDKTARAKGTTKAGKEYDIKYNYADIADVLDAVRPILSKHEIAVMQPTVVDGDLLGIETWLVHKSGEWFQSFYPVCSIQNDHQKMGGAMTYSRRYALGSMIGIAADDDDDGQNAATVNSPRQTEELSDVVKAYLKAARDEMSDIMSTDELTAWWREQKDQRAALGIINTTTGPAPGYKELFGAFSARGKELAG